MIQVLSPNLLSPLLNTLPHIFVNSYESRRCEYSKVLYVGFAENSWHKTGVYGPKMNLNFYQNITPPNLFYLAFLVCCKKQKIMNTYKHWMMIFVECRFPKTGLNQARRWPVWILVSLTKGRKVEENLVLKGVVHIFVTYRK